MTSTATSTSTCTAGTASRWPATPTRRSWRRSATGSPAARTSPSRPRTRSSVAEELARRFGLPLWRFAQLRHRGDHGRRAPDARRHRARPDHQGGGLLPRPPRLGARCPCCPRPRTSVPPSGPSASPATPASPVASATSSWSSASTTPTRLQRVLAEHPGRVAGMIVEPVMMNAGIIPPEPGYLEGLRDLLHRRRGDGRRASGQRAGGTGHQRQRFGCQLPSWKRHCSWALRRRCRTRCGSASGVQRNAGCWAPTTTSNHWVSINLKNISLYLQLRHARLKPNPGYFTYDGDR